jgi:hypothetical protein
VHYVVEESLESLREERARAWLHTKLKGKKVVNGVTDQRSKIPDGKGNHNVTDQRSKIPDGKGNHKVSDETVDNNRRRCNNYNVINVYYHIDGDPGMVKNKHRNISL